ncbi:TIM-barrel domain-containing protein [Paenibacillus ginsengarvi]|nr:TIM-barrel domain-containing protein [Paenibacillus ginsengarvi]
MVEHQTDVVLDNGGIVRVEPLSGPIFRIRYGFQESFPEATMIRYGIVKNEWPQKDFSREESGGRVIFRTSHAELSISRGDGGIVFRDREGKRILCEAEGPKLNRNSGFSQQFVLEEEEKLYGLGDESRDVLQKRGRRARMWVKNVDCYAPIPFLMSSRGWGFFLNTTWRHFFDLGHSRDDRWRVSAKRGELDYYWIAGPDYAKLLDRYTEITGKPHLLPLWAYGLTFVCNEQESAREMLDDAMRFRQLGIPCDLIGLEPGWMQKHYDYSVDKKWHPERFYIPSWAPKGPHTFIAALERLGFKLSLWLCSDYDVTYQEERLASASGSEAGQAQPADGDFSPDDFEQDQRAHAPVYADTLTKRDEPWFRHLQPFVDQGVRAFKMDGARQVNEHPDRKWGNGMDDEEVHNVYPTLLNKQMHLGFKEHTGLRSMIYSSGGYVGIQQYAATWAGDTGGGPRPLVSMLNHGLSGHPHASCDMDVFTADGIHFGFLQPWSQVNSWAYWRHPWLLGEKLLHLFTYYAKLRYRLLPYLYSAAHNAVRTGMPIIRAMPLVYPDDPRSDECLQQYMVGDYLLVAAFTREVHLPEGEWIDYWSGRRYAGPLDITAEVPDDRGGPLFVKAGAVIPTWPDMDYVGHKPVNQIGVHIYPGADSEFRLYEDDGTTYRYLENEVATTTFSCRTTGSETKVRIGRRSGSYEGMPAARTFDLRMYTEQAPAAVYVNGGKLSADGWSFEDGACRLLIAEDEEREFVEVRFTHQIDGEREDQNVEKN